MILSLTYKIIYPLLWSLAFVLSRFFPKVQRGFELRATRNGKKPWLDFPQNTCPIWIHATSGEFEYALPVIRELKAKHKDVKILVTYYTPSYVERISKEPLVDFYCPLPWDFAHTLKEFIEHHQPQQLWIARTGFWPEVLHQCAKANVPISVFSMTFNKKLSLISRWYYRWLLKNISHFFVVSEDDKKILFDTLKHPSINAIGDTRYDQCVFRLQTNVPVKIIKDKLPHKVFICASTWPEDEAVLLPYIRSQSDCMHWIIVPHEVDSRHIAQIQKALHPVRTHLYSQIETWNGDGVLIVDQFGILASLYKISDGAFIGGSFKARVHSVMESLACGNITFVGPYHAGNREAYDFMKVVPRNIPAVNVIPSPKHVSQISELTENWTAQDASQLNTVFLKQTGVSKHLVQILCP